MSPAPPAAWGWPLSTGAHCWLCPAGHQAASSWLPEPSRWRPGEIPRCGRACGQRLLPPAPISHAGPPGGWTYRSNTVAVVRRVDFLRKKPAPQCPGCALGRPVWWGDGSPRIAHTRAGPVPGSGALAARKPLEGGLWTRGNLCGEPSRASGCDPWWQGRQATEPTVGETGKGRSTTSEPRAFTPCLNWLLYSPFTFELQEFFIFWTPVLGQIRILQIISPRLWLACSQQGLLTSTHGEVSFISIFFYAFCILLIKKKLHTTLVKEQGQGRLYLRGDYCRKYQWGLVKGEREGPQL